MFTIWLLSGGRAQDIDFDKDIEKAKQKARRYRQQYKDGNVILVADDDECMSEIAF